MSDGLKDSLGNKLRTVKAGPFDNDGKFIGEIEVQYGPALKEGVKYDSSKPPMALLPSAPLVEISKVLDHGKQKYAAHNWRMGIDYSRLYSATQRHLSSWNEGEDTDTESKLNHLAHAACDILFLLEFELNRERYGKFDDRYKGEK